jgi:Transposase, Mutator family
MGFLDYDVEIRKIICSTNAIESLNAHCRRAVRTRGHFSTDKLRSSASTSSPAHRTEAVGWWSWLGSLDSDNTIIVQRIARQVDLDVTLWIHEHTDLDAMREALNSLEWNDL